MTEKEFFKRDNVLVTNTRFVVGKATYPISNMASVRTETNKPSRIGNNIAIGIGVLLILSAIAHPEKGGGAIVMGGAFVAFGYLWKRKTSYAVTITTSSKDSQALVRHDEAFINEVTEALNQAIIYRG